MDVDGQMQLGIEAFEVKDVDGNLWLRVERKGMAKWNERIISDAEGIPVCSIERDSKVGGETTVVKEAYHSVHQIGGDVQRVHKEP